MNKKNMLVGIAPNIDRFEGDRIIMINNNSVGIDIGTMFLVSAKLENKDNVITNYIRNAFIQVDINNMGSLKLDTIQHVIIDDSVFILSDDAFNYGNIFGVEINRPMSGGLISSKEIDAVDILANMVKSLIGISNNGAVCAYSIPAAPIDTIGDTIYHESVFGRIIAELGYTPKSVNEAVAIVYSEAADTQFSAISISFGAGMTNIAVVYKSIPVVTFSLKRGGDWIDQQVATATSSIQNRVTKIKETDLDLENFAVEKDKKKKRIKEALNHYYKSLISYTLQNIHKELSKIESEFPEELPLIISGGTSLVKGFIPITQSIIQDYSFPFDIKHVRHATNPLTAVAEGCLVKALNQN